MGKHVYYSNLLTNKEPVNHRRRFKHTDRLLSQWHAAVTKLEKENAR